MKRKHLLIIGLVLLVPAVLLWAGDNNLNTVSPGNIVRSSHINQLITAMKVNLVPRNSSGVPTDLSGTMGESSLRWLKAYIASGHWAAGDLKMHHTYNGAVTCGQGWMLADGRVINEANYDAEHSAGDWDIYVVSSPLEGKYLPPSPGKYPVGVSATTQDGTSAITSVGNASHQVDLRHQHTMAHTHSVPSHNHQWHIGGLGNMSSYNSGGSSQTINGAAVSSGLQYATSGSIFNQNAYTSNVSQTTGGSSAANTGNALSTTQSIQPESFEVQYCMRIID